MERKLSKAYDVSIMLWQKLQEEGFQIKQKKDKHSLLSYEREEINGYDIFTKGDYSYVNSEVFKDLGDAAKVMVCKIMVDLKRNNPLWQFERAGRSSKVITELINNSVLYKSGTTGIHYVNPFLIRKGKIGQVLASTIELLKSSTKVTSDHIRAIEFRHKLHIPGYDFLKSKG